MGNLSQNIIRNSKSGLYEITEEGIKYKFEFAMLISLKKFLQRNRAGFLSTWYKQLDAEEKTFVKRVSVKGKPIDDVFELLRLEERKLVLSIKNEASINELLLFI